MSTSRRIIKSWSISLPRSRQSSVLQPARRLSIGAEELAAEQRKYELGSGTIFFVLEAQTELASAQQSLLQSQVGYQMALASVDHATGELLEPYHVQIAELTQ